MLLLKMPAPLLLVDDDLATIAQVKRLLAREGYEVVLATNAADAVIAWGHHLPPLVILNPKVESDRGRVVLDELRGHPDAQLLHVLLLGETVAGFGYPVAPLPLDAETFAQTVHELVQGTTSAEGWQVEVSARTRTEEVPAAPAPTSEGESESWRATRKSPAPGRSNDPVETPEATDEEKALFGTTEAPSATVPSEPPEVDSSAPSQEEPPPPQVSPPTQELENSLFGDLEANMASEVEAQAIASVDESLARMPIDAELQALEDDVRAEAARRRKLRQEPAAPAVGLPTPDRTRAEAEPAAQMDPFAGFDEPAPNAPTSQEPPPRETDDAVAERLQEESQKARETLARAERIAHAAAQSLEQAGRRQAEHVQALQSELAAAHHAIEQAEARGYQERQDRERLQAEFAEGRDKIEGEGKQLWTEVERLEGELTEAKSQRQQRSEAAAMLDLELKDTREQLDQTASTAQALEQALEQTRAGAEAATEQLRSQTEALEAARAEAVEVHTRLARIHEARLELERERDALKDELDANRSQSHELSSAAQRAAAALREAMEEAEQSEVRAEAAQVESQQARAETAASAQVARTAREEGDQLRERAEQATAEAKIATRRATDAEERARDAAASGLAAQNGLRELQTEVEKLKSDFTAAFQAQHNLEEALEDARAANLEVRARADQSESKARVLEERSLMPLNVPNRAPLAVTRFGTLAMGELAQLIGQLVLARAEVRLELAAPGGRRTVWLSRGAVIAAESNFGNESLLDRARRDGLIDARQTADLQMVRRASPAETAVVLKARGLIRDAEVVPLIQRYTEQVALDAFSEPTSEYRLTDEAPGPETLAATLPRPTLPLVAEALRRALPVEELLHRLGGSEAVPVTIESELDLRALGFADKERRMLGYCDGEANVEDLALASGLKADVAFRALLVARLLGLIELKVPARTTVAASPQVDVERLEAKFEQVQDADYFTMLGLGRAAGGDEVSRAWQRLAEEFDPIKYSGHPDTALQQRAQVVYSVLEEAARALGDDRRRAEYARHLVD